MNHNKLSVKQGSIILNGQKIDHVTDFKYECLTNGMASVTICFDVPIKATELTTESVPESQLIDIPNTP